MRQEPIDLGEDAGFVRITMNGVSLDVDVFEVSGRIAEFHKKNSGLPDVDYNKKIIEDVIVPLGYPPCSHALAIRFCASVRKAVADLGNALFPPPASPATSGSTPAR